MSARATTLCPGAGDRIRNYFVTIGVVPLAQQYHWNVTVLSRDIVTLGRDTGGGV
jgi:hypothetical protein